MDEAAKYYANILMPFNNLISKKLEEIQKMNLAIKTIALSHGIIWRKDPGRIVEAWATRNTASPRGHPLPTCRTTGPAPSAAPAKTPLRKYERNLNAATVLSSGR